MCYKHARVLVNFTCIFHEQHFGMIFSHLEMLQTRVGVGKLMSPTHIFPSQTVTDSCSLQDQVLIIFTFLLFVL
jgi:hypothetical protein